MRRDETRLLVAAITIGAIALIAFWTLMQGVVA